MAPRVLEVGAGDGSLSEPLLAYGAAVTATEMSRASLEVLRDRYGHNPDFTGLFDPDGSLEAVGEQRFALALFGSVLHHIPHYLAAIAAACRHLERGGALVTLQDPLWYPRLRPGVRRASNCAYLAWRVCQGNLRRGLRTRLRHARGIYSDQEPGDAVEYHVVRDGVDEEAILELLRPQFERVELREYWSTPSQVLQVLGARMGLRNTFAVTALGFRGRG